MEAFRECGFMSFAVLLLGVIAVVLGLIAVALALLKPRIGLVLAVVALAASCGVPGSGAAGTLLGRMKVDEAVSGGAINPEMRERIRAVGYAEARQCTTLGGVVGALPLVLALGALGVAFARRRADAPVGPS